MSTKIYDVYEWDGTVQEAFTFLMKMRTRVEKQVIYTMSSYKFHNQMPQFKLIEEIQKTIKEGLNGPLNLSCSAVVYLYKDRTFIHFFGLDRTWDKRLSKVKRLKDYHYQNCTDSPQNLTDSQWNTRRKVWKDILGKNQWCPSRAGLTFDFISDSYSSIRKIVQPVYDSLRPVTERGQY